MAPVSAILVGLLYWFVVARLGGQSEPWDVAGYWTIAYPIGLVIAGALGAAVRKRAWAAGALFVLSQALLILASGLGALWGAGLLLLLILAVPGALAAQIGLRLRRQRAWKKS